MDAPDLREMVARAINSADNEWADAPRTMLHEAWPQHVADAVLAVPAIADALAAVKDLSELRQAVWDAYGILGFDQDGDPTPDAMVGSLADFIRSFATEMRKDYDDALDGLALHPEVTS